MFTIAFRIAMGPQEELRQPLAWPVRQVRRKPASTGSVTPVT